MEKGINRKILVIGLVFLFLGASATLGVSASYTNGQLPRLIQQNTQTIQATQKNIVGKTSYDGNVLISTNPANDYRPRIAINSKNQMIVVYEQEIDQFTKQVNVVYTPDFGKTWTQAFYCDSTAWTSGSGILAFPDIVYNTHNDTLWINMIDPNGDQYNIAMIVISADIATIKNATIHRISGTGASNYQDCAVACTNNIYFALDVEDYSGLLSAYGLGLWTQQFTAPTGLHGFYYDGQTQHVSMPCFEIEMGQNDNRIFAVCESRLSNGTKISMKSQVNDETLMMSAEQQNGMDKYGDVEQMPGQYLGAGTDPDVSGSGANVAAVYVQGGDVKCSYSTCDAHTYIPGFNWHVSTVDTGASTPSVYMTGSTVYCAYVKGGNLYLKNSTDAGATWGTATQMNDGGATVMSDPGSVAVCKLGVVFQDTRDGKSHLYCAPIKQAGAPDNPTITGPASGKTGKATTYTFTTIDHENDQVFYYIDWGDTTNSGWVGPYASGSATPQSHTWAAKGDYTIKAKAKDTAGHESDYGTLPVTMPMTMTPPFYQFLEKLFERFPNAFPILRQRLGY